MLRPVNSNNQFDEVELHRIGLARLYFNNLSRMSFCMCAEQNSPLVSR